jgi:DNA-binding protein YbaB
MSEAVPPSLIEDPTRRHEKLREDLVALRRDMAALCETTHSPDGLIVATVGPRCELRELLLDPRIYRTTDSVALGESIVATIREATDAVTARMFELTNALLPEDMRLSMSADLGVDLDAYLNPDLSADGGTAPDLVPSGRRPAVERRRP